MLWRTEWTKSSYSNGNGGNNCVEATISSFANTGGQRVGGDGDILVRHSQHPRFWMAFTHDEWVAFVQGVKAGEFDVE